ncbi:CRISPR-associated helicase Cas3' [Streptomyces sp. NPDC058476]|uniref:CRISPR-associated helicase Cas3' n=1 Tax=Streptomyces sp. NPDC058476 TaxID=3346519 RepID=UPI00365E5BDF
MGGGRVGWGLRGLVGAAAGAVWAKHDVRSDGWLPLWRHMEDSAAVAGRLWDEWLPAGVRDLIARAFPEGEVDGRRLVVWLAGVHDIGKATPAFACQVDLLAEAMRDQGLAMRSRQAMGQDRRLAPHGLAGQVLLGEWLQERYGWKPSATGQFTVVVGAHHGVPPEHGQIKALYEREELLRTPGRSAGVWQGVQTELLDACALRFGVEERMAAWRGVKLAQPVQVLLSALVIVADWIASNPDLFPYFPDGAGQDGDERVAAAWRGLDLPPPWRAEEPAADATELLAARFALPDGAQARPVQEAALELARDMEAPGLMVIEAPMGEGKTEAALAVAEVFAARSGAGGVFFALPTMATGNAMFPRLLDWLERLPSVDGIKRSVHLAHSKAALNEDFTSLMARGGRVAAVDLDASEADGSGRSVEGRRAGAELVAHTWLRGRKRAMLASFVAGTVDQLLFAGLKSRHLALRHLAVAGKVVVIDEAHAYDTYMSVYLDRVLAWLGAYRVPVVVLSATLPAARRRELVEAYAGPAAVPAGAAESVDEDGSYPLLTAVAPGRVPVIRRPRASARTAQVTVEQCEDGLDALVDRLEHELEDGGCVLVVRNTVKRVLETARALRARFGDEDVTVAHSCFVDIDRAEKDRDLLDRFGPPAKAAQRPASRHIVVASQVAEQSLDVDFDLLVTDLCPVDLLLQRIGRLHRHARGPGGRPEQLRTARCLITGTDWQAPVPKPVRGSVAVYGAHSLLRSAAVLLPHLDANGAGRPVRLPGDISTLVQQAYADAPVGPEAWQAELAEAKQQFDKHRGDQAARAAVFRLGDVGREGRPLFGWVAAGVGDADDTRAGRAQVRDSRESLEVVVLQRRGDGTLATLPWLPTDKKGRPRGGLTVPQDQIPPGYVARSAAACGLRLPLQFSYATTMDRAIEELERLYVPAWQSKDSPWLAGQLILALDEDCQTQLAGFALRYSRTDGLEVIRG